MYARRTEDLEHGAEVGLVYHAGHKGFGIVSGQKWPNVRWRVDGCGQGLVDIG